MAATANIKISTNAWLSHYPNHWRSIPVWALFDDNSIKNEDLIETNVLSLSYGKIIRRDVESNMGLLPESFDTYQIVNTGNIVLRLTDLQNDKRSLRVGFVNEKGIITSAYTGLVLKYPHCLPEYFYYSLHRLDIMKYFYSLGGGVRQSVGYRELKWLKLPVPPVEEQNQIVEYIKKQSEKINRFIAKKQRFIELLKEQRQSVINEAVTKGIDKNVKLKDSGIKWLGDIPEHWEIKRLKNCGTFQSGENITSEVIDDTSDYPVYGGNGLRGYYNQYTHEGDYVLIGRQGALCGNINYASGKFWATEHAVVVTLNEGINHIWFGETLRVMNLNQYSQSSAQPGIAVENIRPLKLPFPPFEEQNQIVQYIKTETATIDKAIAKTEREIELIKEYKEAMIAEAVMGKAKIYNTVNAQ